jgi:hypothetical protein
LPSIGDQHSECAREVEFSATAPCFKFLKLGLRIIRSEPIDYEWVSIKPFLPIKPRPAACERPARVLNGIFWGLRSGGEPARRMRISAPDQL